MAHAAIVTRLTGIHQALMGLFASGGGMSTASRGREREIFIDQFLARVFPPGYRFGTGDAVDTSGRKSGQLDVVVEFTFLPSFPALAGEPRLYLAEGIAAVVEVKSDLAMQWAEVERTSTALRALQRIFRPPGFTPYGPPAPQIPLFAVGYTGWKTLETVQQRADSGVVDGILILDEQLFSTRSTYPGGLSAQGPLALWGLVTCLHRETTSIAVNAFSPIHYFAPER